MIRQGLFWAVVAVLITISFAYGEEVFKEPVLLWERKFSPPIRELSDQNSNGEFLAVLEDKEGMSQKLLVIDSTGNTKREELLPKRKKRTIPAEQLWLTATNDMELEQLKMAKKPKQVETLGEDIFISGSGEYYAILTHGIGSWYEFEYKDKNGKSLWKINPKDAYGFSKAYISYDGSLIIIIDEGGLGGGDEWEVLGQRIYFYNKAGTLLKDYDFRDKMGQWINPDTVKISKNSHYIGLLRDREKDIDRSLLLVNMSGRIVWERKFLNRLDIDGISNNGELLVNESLKNERRNTYLLDNKGKQVWSGTAYEKHASHAESTNHILSASGKYILSAVHLLRSGNKIVASKLRVIDVKLKQQLMNINAQDLFGDKDIILGDFIGISEDDKAYLSIFGHSVGSPKKRVRLLYDLMAQKIVWKGDFISKLANDGNIFMGKAKKVKVYSLKGKK